MIFQPDLNLFYISIFIKIKFFCCVFQCNNKFNENFFLDNIYFVSLKNNQQIYFQFKSEELGTGLKKKEVHHDHMKKKVIRKNIKEIYYRMCFKLLLTNQLFFLSSSFSFFLIFLQYIPKQETIKCMEQVKIKNGQNYVINRLF
jgi:hypothetical protein